MKQISLVNAMNAKEEAIGEAIDEINTIINANEALQRQLGSIVVSWVRTKRVDSIGSETHQTQIKAWAKEFGPKMNQQMGRRRTNPRAADAKLTGLIRSVIQKTNTEEQVDAAAKAVEDYVESNPAATKELARITNTVVNSDKLGNYGTAHCQEVLKKWAKKYGSDKPAGDRPTGDERPTRDDKPTSDKPTSDKR
jgi:DNA repair exonuclease SbcCD ATPase subunit